MNTYYEINNNDPKLQIPEDGLTAKAEEILSFLTDNVIVIENYVNSETTYDGFVWGLLDWMRHGFEHKEFRDHPVMYKFRNIDGEDVKQMPFRLFIFNCIMWRPMVCINFNHIGDHLIISKQDVVHFGKQWVKDYMDINYIEKYNRTIPANRMSEIMTDTNFLLSRISAIFNPFMGVTINTDVFIELCKRYPEFQALTEFRLDESKQPKEMEDEIKAKTDEIIEIICREGQFNCLKPLLQPGAGVNAKQFAELCLNIGLKPDVEGNTIRRPVNTNYLTGGLRNIGDYYTVAISGRKASIINNDFMGKTGHFLNQVAFATAEIRLSKTTHDCNTVNPILITIETEKHLEKLDGRRYRFPGQTEYSIINSRTDKHLIGETVFLRSPITCAAKDGVCRECYGELYYTNKDNVCVGIYSATITMNPVVQGILSAKHHQSTNSTIISFPEEFYKYIHLYSTEGILNPELEDMFRYSLVIRLNQETFSGEDDEMDWNEEEEGTTRRRKKKKQDEDSDVDEDGDSMETRLDYSTTRLEIWKHPSNPNGEIEKMVFMEDEEKEMSMHKDFINRMNRGEDEDGRYLIIPFEDLNPEEFIFIIDVKNNELTRPLKRIEKLLNNSDHQGCHTYDEMVQMMLGLLIESKISAMSVHSEMIIRQMIRDSENILKRPNFSRLICEDEYQILSIRKVLTHNPSITTSLATPYLKRQLVQIQETLEKTEMSALDELYKHNLVEPDFAR